jgi:hypothetical protein
MVFSVLFDPVFPVSLYAKNSFKIRSRMAVMKCDNYIVSWALSLSAEKRLLASSFHPSDRMEQLGSHWTDFHEI